MSIEPLSAIREIARALTDYEIAVEGVIATQSGDDPHAATLAVQAAERAREVLATWTQPEYVRVLLDVAQKAAAIREA